MPDSLSSAPSTGSRRAGAEASWGALRNVLRAQRRAPPLQPVSRHAPMAASYAQQRLWFLERLAPGNATHNQTVAYRLRGTLSQPALQRALDEIVRRHEVLRTT